MEAAPGVTTMEESEAGAPKLEPNPLVPEPELNTLPELPLQAFRTRSDSRMQINAESNRGVFTLFLHQPHSAGLLIRVWWGKDFRI